MFTDHTVHFSSFKLIHVYGFHIVNNCHHSKLIKLIPIKCQLVDKTKSLLSNQERQTMTASCRICLLIGDLQKGNKVGWRARAVWRTGEEAGGWGVMHSVGEKGYSRRTCTEDPWVYLTFWTASRPVLLADKNRGKSEKTLGGEVAGATMWSIGQSKNLRFKGRDRWEIPVPTKMYQGK